MIRRYGPRPRPVAERFWEKVNRTEECWEWTAARKENGYGVFAVNSRTVVYAHRLAAKLSGIKIPRGMCVLHHCDNRPCVRPDHLFIGTHADNMRDMVAKGRTGKHDHFGWKNPRAVIGPNDVPKIRALRRLGKTLVSIGERFGIGPSQVHRIASGKSWVRP